MDSMLFSRHTARHSFGLVALLASLFMFVTVATLLLCRSSGSDIGLRLI